MTSKKSVSRKKKATKEKPVSDVALVTVVPRVQSVYYRTSKCVGQYQHKHVGVRVNVMPGETPEQALSAAAHFVHKELGLPPPVPQPIRANRFTSIGENASYDEDDEVHFDLS